MSVYLLPAVRTFRFRRGAMEHSIPCVDSVLGCTIPTMKTQSCSCLFSRKVNVFAGWIVGLLCSLRFNGDGYIPIAMVTSHTKYKHGHLLSMVPVYLRLQSTTVNNCHKTARPSLLSEETSCGMIPACGVIVVSSIASAHFIVWL